MSIIFSKGRHVLTVVDDGTKARIKGLHGYIDSIELITLLTFNGYKVINQ
jgi:hypothetical protein